LDYQNTSYISSVVEDFGLLPIWHNPRGNNKFVLVKVCLVDPKFVPKSLVIHYLGGARQSWNVLLIMICSSDWNAHEAYVPYPPKDHAPAKGDPHPLFGPDPSAEQLYHYVVATTESEVGSSWRKSGTSTWPWPCAGFDECSGG
jgi:hypothetical protein